MFMVSTASGAWPQVYFFRRTGLRLEPPLEATRVNAPLAGLLLQYGIIIINQ